MGLILFILLGGLAGWIGSLIMKTDDQQGVGLDILVGCVGALLGGLLFNMFGAAGVTGFNVWSMIVAVVGSVALLAIVGLIRRV